MIAHVKDIETTSEESVTAIALDRLHVSEKNTRQPKATDRDIKELAKSLASRGQITPCLVRPLPGRKGHYEIAAGSRRRVAGEVAELDGLNCIVRELDDDTFEELIVLENLQRLDPDPMAEAEVLERIIAGKGKLSLQELAGHLGKSPAWVARRVKLLELIPALRRECQSGQLSHFGVEMMELLGSLPASLQETMLERERLWQVACVQTRNELRQLIDERYTCRLDAAPFPLDDPRFFGECGESGCRSNSADEPLLFDFNEKKCGRCLNQACFFSRLAKWRTHKLAEIVTGEEDPIYFTRGYGSPTITLADGRVIEPLTQWSLRDKHKLELGRKSDGGSRKAIDLSDPNNPKAAYVVPVAKARGKAAKEAPADKTEERRDRLQARRWVIVHGKLVAALEAAAVADVKGDVHELAAVFGLPYVHNGKDESWSVYDKRKIKHPYRGRAEARHEGNTYSIQEQVWEGLVTIFQLRLRFYSVGDCPALLPEMERMAKLIGFDLKAAKKEADLELAAPKSWGEVDPHTFKPKNGK